MEGQIALGLAQTEENEAPGRSADRAILVIMGGGVLTLLAAIWFASTTVVETEIVVDEERHLITLTGPEAQFVGSLEADVEGQHLALSGLPTAGDVEQNALARRAVCLGRDASGAMWTEPSAQLRSHLHSEEFDAICAIYAGG